MYKNVLLAVVVSLLLSCKKTLSNSNNQNNNNLTELTTETSKNKQNAEIVFCLDATGSMSGLIGTAKEKIWDIVSELAQSNDIDTLRLGMVFYRDRGDDFITKKIPLTTDLDEVYSDLLEITADGGGDSPESVNQALHESVNDMDWSGGENTYRTIFVVGDCPPHMDYKDDVPYTVSCEKAREKGIVINTIKLGNSCLSAVAHFKEMAHCNDGKFLRLDQNASDTVVETPYDNEINEVSRKIDDSRLYYGSKKEQILNNTKKRKSMEVYDKSSSTANSARASYKVSKTGRKSWMGAKEIVGDYQKGKVVLEDIEEEELPTVLKDKSIKEKKEIIQKIVEERETNISKLKDLSKKRKEYIVKKSKEKMGKDSVSFSKEVVKVMKKQAKKN